MDRLLEATARAERNHFWFRGFRRFMAPLLAEAVRDRARPSILDCGCGTGHNLLMLRQYGRAVGIDLTWTGLAYAHGRGEEAIAQATATCLPFADGCFEVVRLYGGRRSEERRVGKECVRLCRSRWSPYH